MAMTLKPKPKHPNGSVQKGQDRKKQAKFGQMWRFCSLFSSIANGVVHHEFLPQCRTLNKEYYLEVISRLHEAVRQKHAELWKIQSRILHHDNAPGHIRMLVREYLDKTEIMPQPPHSLALAYTDFFLFPKLQTLMKGKRFAMIEEIKEQSKQELLPIPKSSFQKCFENWKKRWHMCIISEGVTLQGIGYLLINK